MDDQIRQILDQFGHLADGAESIDDDGDLYLAGLTSHNTVNVMLSIEDEFEIEFPESMLRKSTFQTISAIREAVTQLLGESSES